MGGRNADLNLIIAAMPSNEISIAGAAMPNKLDSLPWGTPMSGSPCGGWTVSTFPFSVSHNAYII